MFGTRARDNSCFVAFCNAVGGQDELIFDGHSLVLDEEGRVLARAPGFEEALLVVDIDPADAVGRRLRDVRRRSLLRERESVPEAPVVHVGATSGHREPVEPLIAPRPTSLEQMRLALELGLRDYVEKNGFDRVVVGVFGGIDPGPHRCAGGRGAGRRACPSAPRMPSPYSSEETRAGPRAARREPRHRSP